MKAIILLILSPLPAPCPPIEVVYSGNSTSARVAWNASVFATTYTVYDNSVAPKQQLCSTAALFCSLVNVASTNLVMTASNAAGESETTNVTFGRNCVDECVSMCVKHFKKLYFFFFF